MTERNLSDEILDAIKFPITLEDRWLKIEKVKEVIKLLEEDLKPINAGEGKKFYELFMGIISTRAGPKLVGGEE